jgi:TonB family protein
LLSKFRKNWLLCCSAYLIVTVSFALHAQQNASSAEKNSPAPSDSLGQSAPLQTLTGKSSPPPDGSQAAKLAAQRVKDAAAGVELVGPRVSVPKLLESVDPHYTEEARHARLHGVCLLSLVVDSKGLPQDISVIRSLGMGLDKNAIKAVKKFKFSPAMKDGTTPVPVRLTIEINFHLYYKTVDGLNGGA